MATPYATRRDITDLYGDEVLTIAADRDGDGKPDPAKVDRALVAASGFVSAYEMRRTTPVGEEQAEADLRRQWAVDIGLYLLAIGSAMADEYRKRRDDALKMAKEYYQPAVNGAATRDGTKTTGATFQAETRRFNRSYMSDL